MWYGSTGRSGRHTNNVNWKGVGVSRNEPCNGQKVTAVSRIGGNVRGWEGAVGVKCCRHGQAGEGSQGGGRVG